MSEIPNSKKERIKWLKKPSNRNKFVRQGAGAIYWYGNLDNIDSIKIIVSTRSTNVGGGLAHFGGLGEDEDIVAGDKIASGIKNAIREGEEEIEELLGYKPKLKQENCKFLFSANDDRFFIENGKGFAVDARIHTYRVDDELLEVIFPNGENISKRYKNHAGFEETEQAELLPFKEALKQQANYHYPHEYFSLWVFAAKEMGEDIIQLVQEINKNMIATRINFQKIADDMFITVADLENYLGKEYKDKLEEYENCFKTIDVRNTRRNNMRI